MTPTALGWFQDARLVDAKSADFNGTSTVLTTQQGVVDLNKAFGVTAWVRVG